MYTKIHHSLVDGVSALKLTQRSMSKDPDDTEVRVAWALPAKKRKPTGPQLVDVAAVTDTVGSAVGSVAGLAPSTLTIARAALLEQQLTLPFGAPKTMFNVKIGGARRLAGAVLAAGTRQAGQGGGGRHRQ